MKRIEFLEKLRIELKNNHIQDIEDILEDYVEHFSYKLEEGWTEEEIAKNLGEPANIAKDYLRISDKKSNSSKVPAIIGVSFTSILFAFIYIFMAVAIVGLAAASIISLCLGFCLITTVNIAGIIPAIPYFPSFMLGLAFLAFSLLLAVGTIYLFLYVKHWGKLYFNWSKCVLKQEKFVSTSLHPSFSKKLSSKLKLILIISLIIFVATFIISYFAMCLMANSFEPWHIWKWFD